MTAMAKRAATFWQSVTAALALSLAPGALHAQAAAPTITAPLPGNTARCVYDYMSDEDREMALLLFASEAIGGGKFRKSSKNVQIVDRLIEEAHDKCLNRFAWSIGRSEAAKNYALTAILGEGLRQVLAVDGYPVTKVDTYFTANRAALARKSEIEGADKDRLTKWLIEQGWDAKEADSLNLAALYLETQMLLDKTERFFAYSGGTSRQPVKFRPSPARKAKRGRP
jgi:hypothetical protein